MSQVPLLVSDKETKITDPIDMIELEYEMHSKYFEWRTEKESYKIHLTSIRSARVGLPGDTWKYRVERKKLALRSEWFRAMLLGPLAPALQVPPPIVKLPHLEKRAFDHFLRYLQDEPIDFKSVGTARATLDIAHQYLCPELALKAVNFLQDNLDSLNVLEVYHGLLFYITNSTFDVERTPAIPSAPPPPEDNAGEIATACNRLFHFCLIIIDAETETILSQESFEELLVQEVSSIASRDNLQLHQERVLFSALDRWASSECRRRGIEPTPTNKRAVLPDDVWYSVRYLLMSVEEFIQGPMASGILSSEESADIVSRILGHDQNKQKLMIETVDGPVSKLNNTPRINTIGQMKFDSQTIPSGKTEQDDNRKNRRKECAIQGQRACARIGNCLVRVLACVFD